MWRNSNKISYQIEIECCDPIRSIMSLLQDKATDINQMKSEIQNMKKYSSDLQTFLSMTEIQANTTEYEKHVKSIIENTNCEEISIESAINTKIQDILNVDKFGFMQV